ncbi:hypothetical protein [Gephyromycinifex aptenodytis]|uniref:hypothetical protein n=1 Tax=Gephyromycinifex aptenodytis TaxID=2716227 RepID=UPI0014482793|nr:hypothetical protein [Gephyromycinifex aptenodytis]
MTSRPGGKRVEVAKSHAPDGVRWVCWLFVLNILLQRISLPSISIPFTVPITVIWCFLAWRRGVVVLEGRRLMLWLIASTASAFVVLPQVLFVHRPYISVNSWAFWMTMWFPVVFMMADRSGESYHRMLRAVTTIGLWLSTLSVIFVVTQFAGLRYRDYVGEYVPSAWQVDGFATSYPIVWDSWLYKSNGWIMLEPSFMSFTLGVCVMVALLSRARPWKVIWLGMGMLATVAGSGFAIVVVGVLVMLLGGQRRLIRPYIVPGALLALVAIPTAIGQVFLTRVTEVSDSNSSAALRSIEPYLYLIPRWIYDPAKVWFGAGAGSSRQVVEGSGTLGLIAPTVGKMYFDYGIIAGSLLLALAVVPFLRSHERTLSVAILAQFFLLQPPSQPLIVPAFLVVTLWAPAPLSYRRAGHVGEAQEPPPEPAESAVPAQPRVPMPSTVAPPADGNTGATAAPRILRANDDA